MPMVVVMAGLQCLGVDGRAGAGLVCSCIRKVQPTAGVLPRLSSSNAIDRSLERRVDVVLDLLLQYREVQRPVGPAASTALTQWSRYRPGGHGPGRFLCNQQLHDSGLPADVLVGKLKKDILFVLRRGTIAQVTTALDAAQRAVEDESPSTRRIGIARQPPLPPAICEDASTRSYYLSMLYQSPPSLSLLICAKTASRSCGRRGLCVSGRHRRALVVRPGPCGASTARRGPGRSDGIGPQAASSLRATGRPAEGLDHGPRAAHDSHLCTRVTTRHRSSSLALTQTAPGGFPSAGLDDGAARRAMARQALFGKTGDCARLAFCVAGRCLALPAIRARFHDAADLLTFAD